jgi:hypothetical protein
MMMKCFTFAVSALLSVQLSAAFAPQLKNVAFKQASAAVSSSSSLSMADTAEAKTVFDQEQFIAESKDMRMKHLEEQAMFALKIACENYDNAGEYCTHMYFYT